MNSKTSYPDLKGQSVFITGGGSGIGAALTEGFLQQGAKVTFVQRSDPSEFLNRVNEKYEGSICKFIKCDITDTEALRSAISAAAQAHGPITVLVNNAANDARHSTEEVTEEMWHNLQAINLKSYFFACQSTVGHMKSAGRGSIVNFSSISYMMGNAGYPVYAAANAGITGLTRSLAREFGEFGIRVNALAPGWTLTDRQRRLWATEEAISAHLQKQCLNRCLLPSDISDPTLFLASSASSAITGQCLIVDGGVIVN